MALRTAGAVSIAVFAAITASCADKGLTDVGARRSTSFALSVVAPASQLSEPGPKFVLAAAWYNITTAGGTQARVVLGSSSVALGPSTHTLSFNFDIATCLADPRRAQPAGSCQIDVIAALVADTLTFLGTDSNFAERSWDFSWIQGLDATPGVRLTIPPIELSLTRFDQPTRLTFKTQPPGSFQSGTPFTMEVAVEKAKGGIATTATPTVSLALSGSGAGQLVGQKTRTAVNGVATFTGLTVDNAGAGYVITASSSGLASGNSASFTVTAPPAPPQPPSNPPANVNAYDGTYQASGVVTADDGSTTPYTGTSTVSGGVLTFTVGGFTMTGSVSLSGLVTFVIAPDAATRCNPTAMTAQITISPSGVATMVGSGSQNDRGISPMGGCISGRQTYTFTATRGAPPAPPAAAASDFVGVWTGVVADTSVGGESHPHSAMLIFSMSGGVLSGTANGPGTPPITNVAVTNGVLTFTWPKPPDIINDPSCANWNISVSATLDATRQIMSMQVTGLGCGSSPATQAVNTTAILTKGSGATAADFVGTWTGQWEAVAISGTTQEPVSGSSTMVFTLSGGTLTATELGVSEPGSGPNPLTNIILNGGLLTFTLPKNSNHPDCAAWNVTGTAALDVSRTRMTMLFSGQVCGQTPTTANGTIVLTRSP